MLKRFLLFLKCLKGVGDKTIRKLITKNAFNNLDIKNTQDIYAFLERNKECFSKTFNLSKMDEEAFKLAKTKRIEILKTLEETNAFYLSYFDEDYPDSFRKIKDYPIFIFYKGDVNLLKEQRTCAIIGTRNPSIDTINYGEKIVKNYVLNNYVIISGLALGCDALAHEETLNLNGKTIAIIGNGIDLVYPKTNETLALNILAKGGLIITEELPGTKAQAYTLVNRDRLQTALSLEVVVLETTIDGGTMHAAKKTKDYGKKLFVLDPNLILNGSVSGNLELIKNYQGYVVNA